MKGDRQPRSGATLQVKGKPDEREGVAGIVDDFHGGAVDKGGQAEGAGPGPSVPAGREGLVKAG